jgi:tryptophanyl-tRNA synthetase
MAVKREQLDEIFTYHAPDDDQQIKYAKIRIAGRALADVILECTPVCGDQQAAIRLLREAVSTANMAVALKGLV